MEQVKVQPREGETRCSFCREQLAAAAESQRCPACDTAYHAACWVEMERCAVKGCAGRVSRPTRPTRVPAPRPTVLPQVRGLTEHVPRRTWPPRWLARAWTAVSSLVALWIAAYQLTNPEHVLPDYDRAVEMLPTHWMVWRIGAAVPVLIGLTALVSLGAWVRHRHDSEDA